MADETTPRVNSEAAHPGVSDAQIKEWKAQYGEVLAVPALGRMFFFRKAAWEDVSHFADKALSSVSAACLALVGDTLLSPSRDEFGRLMADHPSLPLVLGAKLQTALDLAEVGDVKKL